jgi:hypothetical protein
MIPTLRDHLVTEGSPRGEGHHVSASKTIARLAAAAWLASVAVGMLEMVDGIDLLPALGIVLALAGTLTVIAATRRNQDKALAEVFRHATMLGRQLPRDDSAIVSTQPLPVLVSATASARARVPAAGEPQPPYESRHEAL